MKKTKETPVETPVTETPAPVTPETPATESTPANVEKPVYVMNPADKAKYQELNQKAVAKAQKVVAHAFPDLKGKEKGQKIASITGICWHVPNVTQKRLVELVQNEPAEVLLSTGKEMKKWGVNNPDSSAAARLTAFEAQVANQHKMKTEVSQEM